eukprot:TRINITY_DN45755_c0_g1_i1.p1 TRINITY_DN45755_c0_g1~~TRINITY_DN45755_c0_g1_i1.p1  ORF type:complete len:284 (+),score=42.60 TRINITY_DN45755_c0_g1_i1:51-902(+)
MSALSSLTSLHSERRSKLASFLGVCDLAKLQLVDTSSYAALDERSLWYNVAQVELPNLILAPELFRTPLRHAVLQLCSQLLRSSIAIGTTITITSAEEVAHFGTVVSRAHRAAVTHSLTGGKAARILVGRFALNRDDDVGPPSIFALEGEKGSPLPAGTLLLRLGVKRQSQLLMEASYHVDFDPSARGNEATGQGDLGAVPFNFTIASGTRSLSMVFRGAPLRLDGRVRGTKAGIISGHHSSGDRSPMPVQEALCVLCLMDGEAIGFQSKLAGALHLDRVRSA